MFATVSAAQPDRSRERAELSRRLRKLERVFRVGAIRSESLGAQQVVDYYEQCFDAYRKHHSAEGALHMALNEGKRFDPDGFYGQLRRIEQGFAAAPPADVLELGFGQGFNLAYLAQRHPRCRFAGIDLTPRHLQMAGERLRSLGLEQVELALGDFHRLPYADASFDQVFCIEALCHATDLPRALGEAARVLRPGGSLVLFDGYLVRPTQELDADEALAVELVARGLAIEQLQVERDLLAAARHASLRAVSVTALDAQVMPSLQRLCRITGAVIRWPWLGRLALARRPAMRGRNVLAGFLMQSTVSLGLIGYRHIVLRREAG